MPADTAVVFFMQFGLNLLVDLSFVILRE